MSVVRATFKPEFLNRLDDIIVFDALSTADLARRSSICRWSGWPGGWPTAG